MSAAGTTKTSARRTASPCCSHICSRAQIQLRSPRALVESVLSDRGTALPTNVQRTMGNRMGFDFSKVRVHADAGAKSSARALGARGWTWGKHIVLGERADANTLAHELAHVG